MMGMDTHPTVTSNILLPTELDTAISPKPFRATITEVIKSGMDVPAAKNVSPITYFFFFFFIEFLYYLVLLEMKEANRSNSNKKLNEKVRANINACTLEWLMRVRVLTIIFFNISSYCFVCTICINVFIY